VTNHSQWCLPLFSSGIWMLNKNVQVDNEI
jgi:hypothetical protein